MVCVPAERRARHGNHVLRDARGCLLRPRLTFRHNGQDPVFQEIQDSSSKCAALDSELEVEGTS